MQPGAEEKASPSGPAAEDRERTHYLDSNLSRNTATPSSSLVSVTSSAAASTDGCAFATATRCQPAHPNIGRSLGMSPNTSTSAGSTPTASATTARPVPLSTCGGQISTTFRPAWVTDATYGGTI